MASASFGRRNSVIIGGGLSGSLVALKWLESGFDDFVIFDSGELLGGDHTWSFHKSDVSEADFEWLLSIGAQSWDRHSVRFRSYDRMLPGTYCSLASSDFYKYVHEKLKNHIKPNTRVIKSHLNGDVDLAGGERINSSLILDARGLAVQGPMGYQKFVGLEIELDEDHGLEAPVIMDATIPQRDGFRFFYLLPLSPRRILVEDTRYSRSAELDIESYSKDICDYISPRWGQGYEMQRLEKGVLPLPMTPIMFQPPRGRWVPIGISGGFYHPVTSYSLPIALQVAQCASKHIYRGTDAAIQELTMFQKSWQKKCGFFFTLNRMMFGAAEDSERIRIFERFYTLPWPLIQRFYAGELKWRDQARLLVGRPPVKVSKAVKSLVQDTWM